LLNLHLTDSSTKKTKEYDLTGFFIEDNSLVAGRIGGEIKKGIKLHPRLLSDTAAVRHDLFQYMIGNTDWSTVNDHNDNTILVNPGTYYPLAYDFDMAGLINAEYAQNNAPTLGTGDIRVRVYRGFCRANGVMQAVRQEFLDKQGGIRDLIDSHSEQLNSFHTKDMHNYLNEFFEMLKDDGRFESQILKTCRTDK
jgi:hypothetical protein